MGTTPYLCGAAAGSTLRLWGRREGGCDDRWGRGLTSGAREPSPPGDDGDRLVAHGDLARVGEPLLDRRPRRARRAVARALGLSATALRPGAGAAVPRNPRRCAGLAG